MRRRTRCACCDGKNPQLPVYLDLEDSGIRINCTGEILRHATIFCETLQAAGYSSVGIYANRYWWTTVLDDPAYDRWDRWLAVWDAETGQRQLQHMAKQQQRPHLRHPGERGSRPALRLHRCARTTRMITASRNTSSRRAQNFVRGPYP